LSEKSYLSLNISQTDFDDDSVTDELCDTDVKSYSDASVALEVDMEGPILHEMREEKSRLLTLV
jgi:hypothetical protein